jgi:hypothetical protein
MSLSWRYTLSAPLVEGASKVSRSAIAAAMFWLALAKLCRGAPSWLIATVTTLAQAQALLRSIVAVHSILSA